MKTANKWQIIDFKITPANLFKNYNICIHVVKTNQTVIPNNNSYIISSVLSKLRAYKKSITIEISVLFILYILKNRIYSFICPHIQYVHTRTYTRTHTHTNTQTNTIVYMLFILASGLLQYASNIQYMKSILLFFLFLAVLYTGWSMIYTLPLYTYTNYRNPPKINDSAENNISTEREINITV